MRLTRPSRDTAVEVVPTDRSVLMSAYSSMSAEIARLTDQASKGALGKEGIRQLDKLTQIFERLQCEKRRQLKEDNEAMTDEQKAIVMRALWGEIEDVGIKGELLAEFLEAAG